MFKEPSNLGQPTSPVRYPVARYDFITAARVSLEQFHEQYEFDEFEETPRDHYEESPLQADETWLVNRACCEIETKFSQQDLADFSGD
tara:strand:- start:444 stop:707 length:264 start_codon:yes stop_codon:yes gene_type:complete